ncbi:hypothetical protein ICNINCKA_00508 [Synechococcus sp. CBW1107]|nr:hypothetical protein ICNINCKA_00508 [Synechococcus sp. CBW1107]
MHSQPSKISLMVAPTAGSNGELLPTVAPSWPAGLADPGPESSEGLIGIDEVQKALNRSRASVYRYTNTDPRNLNPPFNPRKLNPEYRTDQKEALLFHPNEVARFARDVLRIKEVTVEVLNSPSTATQQLLSSILQELQAIRHSLQDLDQAPAVLSSKRDQLEQSRPAA